MLTWILIQNRENCRGCTRLFVQVHPLFSLDFLHCPGHKTAHPLCGLLLRYTGQNRDELHIGKLGCHFGNELVLANFARRIDDEWLLVDQKLGESFMTFLAILIGQETDRDPVTDRFTGVSALFYVDRHPVSKHSAAVQSALRNSMLDEIPPVPKGL